MHPSFYVSFLKPRHLNQPLKFLCSSAIPFDDLHHLSAFLDTATDKHDSRGGGAAHARLLKLHFFNGNSSLWNKLLNLYSRCGLRPIVLNMFDTMPNRDIVSYNTVISSQPRSDSGAFDAMHLYARLLHEDLQPNHITFSALLAASHGIVCPQFVEQIHAQSLKLGLNLNGFVGSAIVNAYEKCRGMEEAIHAFEEIVDLDSVCWNVMIDVCARRGSKSHIAEVFSRMRKEGGSSFDCFTLTSVLKTCLEKGELYLGMQLHGCAWKAGLESEAPTGNALITMYLNCGEGMSSAIEVFRRILKPNIISWTAMISGLMQNGLAAEAAGFYKEMVNAGVMENDFCFTSLLPVSGMLASLEHGRMVHCRIQKSAFCSDVMVGNALIDMYFKCGSLEDGQLAFETMTKHDTVSWTIMILGFGQHGEGDKALEIFRAMTTGGFIPDSVTFLAILSACSHGGLVDEGLRIFHSMVDRYKIKPKREHCACIVDLLGRAGRLKEAESFIGKMEIGMDPLAWEALLGACGMHGEMELGQRSAEKIMVLEPQKDGPYVLLSNMYAERRRWQEKENLRERLDSSRSRKDAACSWFPDLRA
ncbi:putative pentatricopeptide repeat-containing protein At3g15130 [Typha latifolia]|uniref:putative pentatricopeptide repeat-containing protein At3g15130 n=1 Tax=Typha latifolia TaxID=4733 RepID=UPI003C2C0F5E